MEEWRHFKERAAQCRRLASSITDIETIRRLTEMADALDAKAEAAWSPNPPLPREADP